ncbi:MAG: RNA 2',3'-cyclic phosphodiesterase [Chloroflexi bacterium]|nr:RNA 2',3'-cyclic phosphodiesterase [Chloroflexota bacterium]MCC6891989.1 RNA 2',3'-cyclic phosphodiesterase [Anaerolineae bacterium]
MTTQRLFIALDLPDAVKAQLKALQTGVPGAKWVKPEQMHLTLRFIGDATEEQSKQLEMGLAEIKAAPFSFQLQRVGQFPPKGKARVLWVGISPLEAINVLQKQVEQAVTACGFARADHPFAPHITLARFRMPPPVDEMTAYLQKHTGFTSSDIHIRHFALYASMLTPSGPIYRVVKQVDLA